MISADGPFINIPLLVRFAGLKYSQHIMEQTIVNKWPGHNGSATWALPARLTNQ